jgi:hypothetical protein
LLVTHTTLTWRGAFKAVAVKLLTTTGPHNLGGGGGGGAATAAAGVGVGVGVGDGNKTSGGVGLGSTSVIVSAIGEAKFDVVSGGPDGALPHPMVRVTRAPSARSFTTAHRIRNAVDRGGLEPPAEGSLSHIQRLG